MKPIEQRNVFGLFMETVMYVYLDIDETRARNNYKTFDEAVNSLREKCFGKEKEQKPIIKKMKLKKEKFLGLIRK